MKASELRPGEYGVTVVEGVLIIRTAQGYVVAYNHTVKRCTELPFDTDVKNVKTLDNAEYIVQYDGIAQVATDYQVKNLVKIGFLQDKAIIHLTITRI